MNTQGKKHTEFFFYIYKKVWTITKQTFHLFECYIWKYLLIRNCLEKIFKSKDKIWFVLHFYILNFHLPFPWIWIRLQGERNILTYSQNLEFASLSIYTKGRSNLHLPHLLLWAVPLPSSLHIGSWKRNCRFNLLIFNQIRVYISICNLS